MTYDDAKPNHFFYDGAGDPLNCKGDHNHPESEDDEPAVNARIRAEHGAQ